MSRVVVQEAAPSAARLTGSLRDIGYDFQTAVADLVDNCVAAGARHVDVELNYVAGGSYVLVSDDGVGMSSIELLEALRFGSRRSYRRNELGRFGLGLKTGSFSQCRRLTVVSRHAKHQQRIQRAPSTSMTLNVVTHGASSWTSGATPSIGLCPSSGRVLEP